MNSPLRLSILTVVLVLASCAPTATSPRATSDTPATEKKPSMPNPAFTAGQTWEITWEDGTPKATVEVPAFSFEKAPYQFYTRRHTNQKDGVSFAYEFANTDIRANLQIKISKALSGFEKDCIVIVEKTVDVGQTLNGVYIFQMRTGAYGKYLRTGNTEGLLTCTMKRLT